MSQITCPVCTFGYAATNITNHIRKIHSGVQVSQAAAAAVGLVACSCGQVVLNEAALRKHQGIRKCQGAPSQSQQALARPTTQPARPATHPATQLAQRAQPVQPVQPQEIQAKSAPAGTAVLAAPPAPPATHAPPAPPAPVIAASRIRHDSPFMQLLDPAILAEDQAMQEDLHYASDSSSEDIPLAQLQAQQVHAAAWPAHVEDDVEMDNFFPDDASTGQVPEQPEPTLSPSPASSPAPAPAPARSPSPAQAQEPAEEPAEQPAEPDVEMENIFQDDASSGLVPEPFPIPSLDLPAGTEDSGSDSEPEQVENLESDPEWEGETLPQLPLQELQAAPAPAPAPVPAPAPAPAQPQRPQTQAQQQRQQHVQLEDVLDPEDIPEDGIVVLLPALLGTNDPAEPAEPAAPAQQAEPVPPPQRVLDTGDQAPPLLPIPPLAP